MRPKEAEELAGDTGPLEKEAGKRAEEDEELAGDTGPLEKEAGKRAEEAELLGVRWQVRLYTVQCTAIRRDCTTSC